MKFTLFFLSALAATVSGQNTIKSTMAPTIKSTKAPSSVSSLKSTKAPSSVSSVKAPIPKALRHMI